MAGTTGSGKSEFLKSILAALAHRLPPEDVQFVLIDPKRVTFNFSGESPYFRFPVAYDVASALPLLKECEQETFRRYNMLQKMQKSDIGQLDGSQASLVPRFVVIIDEFANLMEENESNKVLVGILKKIGAMSRAAGIHLILATQRPDSTVVPMLVRSNLPGKIALQVDSEQNSKLILDSPAAAYLLGKGDLIFKRGGALIRAQSPMVPQAELEKLLESRGDSPHCRHPDIVPHEMRNIVKPLRRRRPLRQLRLAHRSSGHLPTPWHPCTGGQGGQGIAQSVKSSDRQYRDRQAESAKL